MELYTPLTQKPHFETKQINDARRDYETPRKAWIQRRPLPKRKRLWAVVPQCRIPVDQKYFAHKKVPPPKVPPAVARVTRPKEACYDRDIKVYRFLAKLIFE